MARKKNSKNKYLSKNDEILIKDIMLKQVIDFLIKTGESKNIDLETLNELLNNYSKLLEEIRKRDEHYSNRAKNKNSISFIDEFMKGLY